MLRRRPALPVLATGALVAGLLSVGALSSPASAAPSPDAAAAAAEAREHRRVVDFWTVDKIRKAVPRDFVKTAKGFAPAAKPVRGVTGASWTGGGDVVKTTGKVFFAMGGSYYVCSADLVTDGASDRDVATTAGHCLYDETARSFATNWVFIPDYDSAPATLDGSLAFCAQTTYGCWTASALVAHSGYTTAGGFTTQATLHDWGFAVLKAGGKANALPTTALRVTPQDITFSVPALGGTVNAFGYPASGKYQGKDLVYCSGPLTTDSRNGNQTLGVACDMTGGSSGGPWLTGFSGGRGTQFSVNSYGYSNVSFMYGPRFDGKTRATYDAARTATGNTVVSGG